MPDATELAVRAPSIAFLRVNLRHVDLDLLHVPAARSCRHQVVDLQYRPGLLRRLYEARYKSISKIDQRKPPQGQGAFPDLLLSRSFELSGAEEISYAF